MSEFMSFALIPWGIKIETEENKKLESNYGPLQVFVKL